MMNIAILVDLELNEKSGGHVKFWERICFALKNEKNDFNLTVYFLGKERRSIRINQNIDFKILKPVFSSKILRCIGIDADHTDLSPINIKLLFLLQNFDIIHTTDQLFTMSKTAKLASKFWKIPLTTSYHTDTPSYSKYYVQKIINYFPNVISNFFTKKINLANKVEKKQKKKILDYLMHCKYAMIDQSLSDKSFNMEKISSCSVEKMSRGVDKNIFKKKNFNKDLFLKKYKIPRKNKLIFFCGRIHELKGSTFLSKIHKSLSRNLGNITTVLAGENINGEECKSIGGKDLIIINHLDQIEVSSFLNVCDLFVFPSLFETGPQVVLEAKSCEAICVVSPSGGGRRIEKNGFDGVIIKRHILKDWILEIEDLLKNPKRINFIKNNLRKNFNQPSWKKVFEIYFLEKWKKIYSKNANDLKMH
tara:strand:+ start:59 stop:1318 length:1260 start_codon:yes stop_codon:yes gene_type:complete